MRAAMLPPNPRRSRRKSSGEMVITKDEKAAIIKDFRIDEKDSGSPEVQVALLTHRIKYMTEHLRGNKNDQHNRRGLQMMVSQRSRLLKYLRAKSFSRYTDLIKRLELRR